MEDPVRFDCWGRLVSQPPQDAASWLGSQRGLDWRDAKVELVRAHARSRPLLLTSGVGWDAARSLRTRSPSWIGEVTVYQEGYGPDDPPSGFCPAHRVHYAGVLGCHICTGECVP